MTYHVKGISHKSKRVGKETRDDLYEEKDRINGDHDLDPGALGPSHLLKNTHDGKIDGRKPVAKKRIEERKKWLLLMKMGKRKRRKGKKLEGKDGMGYGCDSLD